MSDKQMCVLPRFGVIRLWLERKREAGEHGAVLDYELDFEMVAELIEMFMASAAPVKGGGSHGE